MGIVKTRYGYIVPVPYNGMPWRVQVTKEELIELFQCEDAEAFLEAVEDFTDELTRRAAANCHKQLLNYLERKAKESEVKNVISKSIF